MQLLVPPAPWHQSHQGVLRRRTRTGQVMNKDRDFQDTVDAINSYHIQQYEQGLGFRARWAEIWANLRRARLWRHG